MDAVVTSQPGEYMITFDVADFSGNDALQVTRRVIVAAADTPWTSWFVETGLSGRPEEERMPEADPDLDGMPNLLEYAIGGNPMASDHEILPQLQIMNGSIQIIFVRLKASHDNLITYKPQVTNNLNGSWSESGLIMEGATEGVSQALLPDGKAFGASRYERVRVTAETTISNSPGKQFLRVVIDRTQ